MYGEDVENFDIEFKGWEFYKKATFVPDWTETDTDKLIEAYNSRDQINQSMLNIPTDPYRNIVIFNSQKVKPYLLLIITLSC